ncbi:MAG: hypothetical protein OET08_14355, partial [Desulfuromonadales bacterium]|nr:hypothetical protein [Desulfuromonadales bacterium]
TSGIRIGTPASTTRGLKENEMRQIGAWIDEALQNIENEAVLARIRGEIRELCSSSLFTPIGSFKWKGLPGTNTSWTSPVWWRDAQLACVARSVP